MPLILQDDLGTVVGANAYVDVAYVDAYFTLRARDDAEWVDYDEDVKDGAIICASSYMDNSNIGILRGRRLNEAQLTQFPRLGITDYDGFSVKGIPELWKMATAEYSIRAIVERLAPDLEYDDSGVSLKSKSEKIGPITETTVYQDGQFSPRTLRRYPEADMLIAQYLFLSNHIVRA